MTFQQLRYFLALCEEQSFTRAAKRCGVSQPSLTLAIKQLEAEFGGPLFVRSTMSSRLSYLGEAIRPSLTEMACSAANAKREAAKILAVNSISPLEPKERSMPKIFYGAAIAAAALLFIAVVNIPHQRPATASPTQASEITDVRALMSTIDVKALPRQEILSEADE
jgi:Bacterial regulatory helix-turn-helix protein, lysR family